MRKPPHIEPVLLKKLRSRIIQIMQEKDIPLEAIADRTGFGSAQVYRIIYGKQNTAISNLFAIAKAMEIHILEFFVFEFPIPEYDISISYYRKNLNAIANKNNLESEKKVTAAEVLRRFIKEGYFRKSSSRKSEKTLATIVGDSKQRFRPDFKNSEFSSALKYATKTNALKRYKQDGSGPYVYYEGKNDS